jgi:hypothetical protein
VVGEPYPAEIRNDHDTHQAATSAIGEAQASRGTRSNREYTPQKPNNASQEKHHKGEKPGYRQVEKTGKTKGTARKSSH